jgi:putative membrane protein
MTGRARRPADVVTVLAGGVTVAAMVATPLLARGGAGRRRLTSVVVTGLAVTTGGNALARWGARRTAATAALLATATAAVERIGTGTGLPFGRYSYTGALRPEVAGVPAIVPLAWFAMAVPSRDAAHRALGARSGPASRVALGAAALTAWDLFLDPQMVGEGYWAWTRRGRYRGIPLTNFLGWFVTSVGVMAALELLLPESPEPGPAAPAPDDVDRDGASSPALTVEYAYMAVMETIGFARFFGDPLVAAVGGAAMLPLAVAALVRGRRG